MNNPTLLASSKYELKFSAKSLKGLIIYILFLWPFLWENARQIHGTAQIIQLSASVLRFVEPVFLTLFLFYVLLSGRQIKRDYIYHISTIVGIGLFSGLFNHSDPQAIFEETYKLVRPFLVLFIVANLNLDVGYITKVFKLLLIIAIVNSTVQLYQYIALDISGDFAGGLMSQSHVYANYIFITIFFCLAYIYVKKKYVLLLLLIPFIISTYIAAHEKASVIAFGIIFFYLWIILSSRPVYQRVIIFILVALVLFLGLYQLTIYFSPNTIVLTNLYIRNITRLGFIQGYINLSEIFASHPAYAICGFGPGNYGSTYATVGRRAEFIERKEWARDVYKSFHPSSISSFFKGRSALAAMSNQIIAVLSEYGFIGLIIWGLAFQKLLKFLFSNYSSTDSPDVQWASLGCILGILFIIAIAFLHLTSGYSSQSNIFPLMIISGLLYSIRHDDEAQESGITI